MIKNLLFVFLLLGQTLVGIFMLPDSREPKTPLESPYSEELSKFIDIIRKRSELTEPESKRLDQLLDLEAKYYEDNQHSIPSVFQFWLVKRPFSLIVVFATFVVSILFVRKKNIFDFNIYMLFVALAILYLAKALPDLETLTAFISAIIADNFKVHRNYREK